MKRRIASFIIVWTLLLPVNTFAQEEDRIETEDSTESQFSEPYMFNGSPTRIGYIIYPTNYGIWSLPPLHYGLNGNVEAGVRVGWGRHNPWKGASFFTNLAGLYAMPLSKDGRWTAAIGGYYSNYRLWGEPINSLGLTALVDYRINEKLNLTGFVAHDFGDMGSKRFPYYGFYGLYPLDYTYYTGCPSTTVGADLGIQVSEKLALSIGISVTRQQMESPVDGVLRQPIQHHTDDRNHQPAGSRQPGGL